MKTLNTLSIKLVEIRKHETHLNVYLLSKLALLLPVTTSVENNLFRNKLYKSKMRNSMGKSLLNDSLVDFLDEDSFLNVNIDCIATIPKYEN